MIELLALALIPITSILAAVSIVTKALCGGPYKLSTHSGLSALGASTALDAVGIVMSELALYWIVRITIVSRYSFPSSVTYTLSNLRGFGYWTAVLLGLGLIIEIISTTVRLYHA